MTSAIVIFDMDYKRFSPHNLSDPIPPRSHKASVGTFEGPHAMIGADRAAKGMQETYNEDREPYRRLNSAISKAILALFAAGHGIKKIPADFVED